VHVDVLADLVPATVGLERPLAEAQVAAVAGRGRIAEQHLARAPTSPHEPGRPAAWPIAAAGPAGSAAQARQLPDLDPLEADREQHGIRERGVIDTTSRREELRLCAPGHAGRG